MSTTRRQFLKLLGIGAAATIVPVGLLTVAIELEPVIDEQLFKGAITITGATKSSVVATIDMDNAWRAVYLKDQFGNRWRTEDQGKSWSWNGHTFRTDDEGRG